MKVAKNKIIYVLTKGWHTNFYKQVDINIRTM